VAGAGRGIGRATALLMARAGADVCVADFDEAAAAGVADEVRGLGRRATVAGGNVGPRPPARSRLP
jgi:NAD(P)-dependent dehydrogenase (short-subunit alcohol dehydrogenase family)